ncbi:hypothetical protein CRG98_041950 [Punica granatum]|uniref:Uncharacterized protein n=1 Tax=Punica granatum TaxID=22663 RepID=A0A2I0I119_PUNGR|nr:hypothetical protein CRG98_041950 [Punica granatum]
MTELKETIQRQQLELRLGHLTAQQPLAPAAAPHQKNLEFIYIISFSLSLSPVFPTSLHVASPRLAHRTGGPRRTNTNAPAQGARPIQNTSPEPTTTPGCYPYETHVTSAHVAAHGWSSVHVLVQLHAGGREGRKKILCWWILDDIAGGAHAVNAPPPDSVIIPSLPYPNSRFRRRCRLTVKVGPTHSPPPPSVPSRQGYFLIVSASAGSPDVYVLPRLPSDRKGDDLDSSGKDKPVRKSRGRVMHPAVKDRKWGWGGPPSPLPSFASHHRLL